MLLDASNDRAYGTDIRVEATALVRSVTEPNFSFIAVMVHKILQLLEPANKMQAENTDLLSATKFVNLTADCVQELRSEDEFNELWRISCDLVPAETRPNNRQRTMSKKLEHYSAEETVGQHERCDETELRLHLYFSSVESVRGEMAARFGECNSKLIQALAALDPAGESFLDKTKLKPLLDLTGAELVDSENTVAKKFLCTDIDALPNETWTVATLMTMPSVVTAFKHGPKLGASTAMCQNSFSTLKKVFSDQR